jgi:hypothetical protein
MRCHPQSRNYQITGPLDFRSLPKKPSRQPMPTDPADSSSTPKAARLHRPSDVYGIARKSLDGAGQQAWLVQLSRAGRIVRMTFCDAVYGGRSASIYVARAFRDAVLEIVPPLTKAELRQVNRKKAQSAGVSAMTGVH